MKAHIDINMDPRNSLIATSGHSQVIDYILFFRFGRIIVFIDRNVLNLVQKLIGVIQDRLPLLLIEGLGEFCFVSTYMVSGGFPSR